MGLLRQASATSSDCMNLTISTWVYVPEEAQPATGTFCRYGLFEFGYQSLLPNANNAASYLRVSGTVGGASIGAPTQTGGTPGITVNIAGRAFDDGFGGTKVQNASQNTTTTYSFSGGSTTFAVPQTPISFGDWHHLFLAVDWAGATYLASAGYGTVPMWLYLDRQLAGYGRNPSNQVLPDGLARLLNADYLGFGSSGIAVQGQEMSITRNLVDDTFIGVNAPSDADICFAYFQAWFGTYINPSSSNLDLFAIPSSLGSSAGIRPAYALAASDVFGPPTVQFIRDSVSGILFEENLGTGGTFEVIGTIEDFVPRPEDILPA